MHSGVVGMFMNYNPATPTSGFVCSGTLLADRNSILTAAHCVSDGFGTAGPASTTVVFQPSGGLPVNSFIYANPAAPPVGNPAATAIAVSQIFVNPGYTGQVIDQNDIAVLRLAAPAPVWASSYGIYGGNLNGTDFNVAGSEVVAPVPGPSARQDACVKAPTITISAGVTRPLAGFLPTSMSTVRASSLVRHR